MDLKESDYKSMRFPFNLIGDADPLEVFPILSKYEEFNIPIEQKDKIIKYILLVYDPGSPLRVLEPIPVRKANAAMMAGFKYKSEKFEDAVLRMMECGVLEINRMIIRFCRLFGERSYTLMVSGNEAFHDAIGQLMLPSKGDDAIADTEKKQKIFQQAKSTAEALDKMAMNFLMGDNTKPLNKTLYTIIESENSRIKLSPEDFAL